MFDAVGRVLHANEALVQLVRRHPGVTISQDLLELKDAADRRAFQSVLGWRRDFAQAQCCARHGAQSGQEHLRQAWRQPSV